MYIAQKLHELMIGCPKTNAEMSKALGINTRIISGIISQNKRMFVRLDKGYVGLRGRDEHLVVVKQFQPIMKIHMKICNCLADGEKTISDLYKQIPDVKEVSIRATISMRPDLFIRLKDGVIGRVGRDENLIEFYRPVKKIVEPRLTITMCLEMLLLDGAMHLHDIYDALPNYPRNQITSKLSLRKQFVKIAPMIYKMKGD